MRHWPSGLGTTCVCAASRNPCQIKPSGRRLVPQLTSHLLPATDTADDSVLHVALGSVGGTACPEAAPTLIVILHLLEELDGVPRSRWQEIHPADAVVRLMAETMDAGRFGPRAVVELGRLAARCRCCELAVGTPEDAALTIEKLFEEPTNDPLPVEELHDGAHIRPNVVSLLVIAS